MKRSLAAAFALSLLLVCGHEARAGALVAAGSNLAFEYANNGRTFESRQPLAIRAGYRFESGDLFLERATFSVSQGTAAVQVRRNHEEWIGWARKLFVVPSLPLKPFAALGGGLQSEKVETTLNGATSTNSGRGQLLASAAAGFTASTVDGLTIDLELRASASSGYSPNPLPQFGFFVGWCF